MVNIVTSAWPPTEWPGLVFLHRAAVAFGVAAVISAVIRLAPHGPSPSRHGGWRELAPTELE